MSIRPAVAFLLASLFSLPCQAKEAKIGEASITLTVPAGQCELDPKQPGDARMLQVTEGALTGVGNRLLGFYADCKQLTDWRTGKRPLLEDFAQYQTLIAAADAPAPAAPEETIRQFCSDQRQQGEKAMSGLAPDIKARIEEAVRGVTVNQMRFLGVVAEENLAPAMPRWRKGSRPRPVRMSRLSRCSPPCSSRARSFITISILPTGARKR